MTAFLFTIRGADLELSAPALSRHQFSTTAGRVVDEDRSTLGPSAFAVGSGKALW